MNLRLPTVQDVAKKRVLLRVDYNVPLRRSGRGWRVTSDKRLRASIQTIEFLRQQGAIVILISHLGRPNSAKDKHLSLKPVADYVHAKLRIPVKFVPDTVEQLARDAVHNATAGQVLLLENLRFHQEEEANDADFSKNLASLADIYINDAFSAAHRAHASVVGVAKFLPSYAGFSLAEEVKTLSTMVEKPKRPFVVIIGGAKISDKVGMLRNLTHLADIVLIGGASANTFLKAEGLEIYRSRVEELDGSGKVSYVKIARQLIEESKTEKVLKDNYIPLPKIIFPFDVVAAPNLDTKDRTKTRVINLTHNMADSQENEQWQYLDIGPKTRRLYAELIAGAGSVFWNGPMGVWENPLFAAGTRTVGRAIVQSRASSVLGGGDTIAAAQHFHVDRKFTFVSAAGGAALEFLGGKMLPGVRPLVIQSSATVTKSP